ncbi:MAG: hypothetical protein NC548_30965 [Lachnospiraceae bacterium]|nr:hypothetical protein [Lachnospiraceae bacterium]
MPNNYNQKYNKDDVFTRSMIVCLLAELNKKIYYYNRLDNEEIEKVNVPCLYSITGGERFLRDEFYYDALEQGKAIGDYEKVPRCILSLGGISVNSGEQTNKYNRTKIVRTIRNKVRTLYLNVEWIPINLNFDCKVICSNNIELFKITECIISKIYKNPNFFKVDYGMFNVDASMSVPTDYTHERPQEFGLNDKKEFLINFTIEMKTLMPAFEHGLLLCEIDQMLQNLPDDESGIVIFRPNEDGEMEMQCGGVLETFITSEYHSSLDSPTIESNTHPVPPIVRDLKDLEKKDEIYDMMDRRTVTP